VNEYVAGMFGRYNLLTPEQAALFGIELNDKNIIIRPEDFIIGATSENGKRGIVQKISFWGSFYELEVAIGEFKIIVRIGKNEWRVDENIFVNYESKF
jgi:iron(III) transport system ATP-binding protein